MNIELLWAFVTGLAGSLHCLGMCGPLVIAYSLHLKQGRDDSLTEERSVSASFTHHAAFQAGRIASYGFLGGIAAAFVYFGRIAAPMRDIRTPVTIGGGIAMVLFGLIITKMVSVGPVFENPDGNMRSFVGRYIGKCLVSPHAVAKGALGFLSGFLPCMLSWAMVVKAALSADIFSGFLLMVLFGLGTTPALLFMGFLASLFSLKGRLAGEKLAGLSVIIMGLVILWKGVLNLV